MSPKASPESLQLDKGGLLQALVALREHVLQLGVVGLYEPHGGVDGSAEVFSLW
jgi:hypothetical protein